MKLNTLEEIEEYCNRVAKKFFAKYTDQYEECAGEEVSAGIFVVYYYHTIMDDTIGVYLDENDELQVYKPKTKPNFGYGFSKTIE